MLNLPGFSSFSTLQKRVGALTIANATKAVFTLIVAVVLVRILNPENYGLYKKLWLLFSVTGPVFISAMVRTLYYRGGRAEESSVAVWAVFITGIGYGILVAAIAIVGAPYWGSLFNAPELETAFRRFALFMGITTMAGLAEPVFIIIGRKKWLVYFNIIYNLVEACLIITPFALGLPLEQVVLVMAIGPLLRLLFILWLVRHYLNTVASFSKIADELPLSLKYGAGILLTTFVGVAISDVDKWVVSLYFESNAIYAIYAIGARRIPFISALTTSVSSSLVYQYTRELENNRFEEMLQAAKRITNRLALVIVPLVLILALYAEELIVLVFESNYVDSTPIFRVYLISILSTLVFPHTVILGKGLSHIQAKFGMVELLSNLAISVFLVQYVGLLGPAIATVTGNFIYMALNLRYCRTHFKVPVHRFLPSGQLWPALFQLLLFGAASYWVKAYFSLWVSIPFSGALLALLYLYFGRRYTDITKRLLGDQE